MAQYCKILYQLLVQLAGRKGPNSSELAAQEVVRLNRVQRRLTCGAASFGLMRKSTSFRETSKNPGPEEITLLKRSFQQWIHTRHLSGPAQATLLTKMTRFLIDANEKVLEDPRTNPFTFVLTQGLAELSVTRRNKQLFEPGEIFEVNADSDFSSLVSLEACVLWGLHKDDLREALRQASIDLQLVNGVEKVSTRRLQSCEYINAAVFARTRLDVCDGDVVGLKCCIVALRLVLHFQRTLNAVTTRATKFMSSALVLRMATKHK